MRRRGSSSSRCSARSLYVSVVGPSRDARGRVSSRSVVAATRRGQRPDQPDSGSFRPGAVRLGRPDPRRILRIASRRARLPAQTVARRATSLRRHVPPDGRGRLQAVYETALGTDLSAAAVPQTLSRELTGLRPRNTCRSCDGSARATVSARSIPLVGRTRYFLTMCRRPCRPLTRTARRILALYESVPEGSRASSWRAPWSIGPESQLAKVFDPGFDPYSTVVVDRGRGLRADVARRATIGEDTTARVVSRRPWQGGGYLVLLDSSIRMEVEVDGRDRSCCAPTGLPRRSVLGGNAHGALRTRRAPCGGCPISLVSLALLAVAFSRRDPSST